MDLKDNYPYSMGLFYFEGILPKDELNHYIGELNEQGIKLLPQNKNGQILACLEEFTNDIVIALGSSLFQAYAIGVLSSTTFEVAKNTIVWIWKSLKNRTITKIQGHSIKNINPTFGMKVNVDKNTSLVFRLDGEIDDNLKEKCIIQAFEYAKFIERNKKPSMEIINVYNQETSEWKVLDINEIIRIHIEKQKNNT